MPRKAQYVIVEQVLVFLLGLLIAVGFTAAFGDLGDTIEEDFTTQQLDTVGALIAGHVTSVYRLGDDTELVFPLPSTIGGSAYTVNMTQDHVRINTSDRGSITHVKSVNNTVTLQMRDNRVLESNVAQGKLTYNGTHIILEGFA